MSGDGVAEINIGLAAWTDPLVGSIILQYGGTTFETDARGGWSNTPSAASAVISFEDPNDEIAGAVLALGGSSIVSGAGGTIGATAYDGIVSGFVIFQNAADLPANFRQPQDFTRIFMHEVGHTIGFDHTPLDGSRDEPGAQHHVLELLYGGHADSAGPGSRRPAGPQQRLPGPPVFGTDDDAR